MALGTPFGKAVTRRFARSARSASASSRVLRRRSDAPPWSRRNRPWSPSFSPRCRRPGSFRPRPSPTIWQPTTRSVDASTTSFISTRVSRPDSVAFIGRNVGLVDIDMAELRARLRLGQARRCRLRAARIPRSARRHDRRAIGLLPNTVSANACPSRIATGVRLRRWVTSPTA